MKTSKSPFCLNVVAVLTLLLLPAAAVDQFPERLHALATPVEVYFKDGTIGIGSGFFFQVLAPRNPEKSDPQWRAVLQTHVITNRHVIRPERFSQIEKFVFSLRKPTKSGADWIPVEIPAKELAPRLRFHPNAEVDVAAIDVLDLIQGQLSKPGAVVAQFASVSRENFPGISKLPVSASDDAIVIGYPRQFYDRHNKLPVMKLAMVASPWGARYENQDAFLVDYRGFPGSSGSVVVSRPTSILVDQGRLYTSKSREYLFLGVYSGEPYFLGQVRETDDAITREKVRVGLGLVWYPHTVEETINAEPVRDGL